MVTNRDHAGSHGFTSNRRRSHTDERFHASISCFGMAKLPWPIMASAKRKESLSQSPSSTRTSQLRYCFCMNNSGVKRKTACQYQDVQSLGFCPGQHLLHSPFSILHPPSSILHPPRPTTHSSSFGGTVGLFLVIQNHSFRWCCHVAMSYKGLWHENTWWLWWFKALQS